MEQQKFLKGLPSDEPKVEYSQGKQDTPLHVYISLVASGIVIVVNIILFVVANETNKDLEQQIESLQRDARFCLLCNELKVGPFAEDNDRLKTLERMYDSGQEICCGTSQHQIQEMLDMFKEKRTLKKCHEKLQLNETNRLKECPTSTVPPKTHSSSIHLTFNGIHDTGHGLLPLKSFDQNDPTSHVDNVDFSEGKLKIKYTGVYHVYSQVHFEINFDEKNRVEPIILQHKIMRYNQTLPRNGKEELTNTLNTVTVDKERNSTSYTSYTAVTVPLFYSDIIYVQASYLETISRDTKSSFFGLYRIGEITPNNKAS